MLIYNVFRTQEIELLEENKVINQDFFLGSFSREEDAKTLVKEDFEVELTSVEQYDNCSWDGLNFEVQGKVMYFIKVTEVEDTRVLSNFDYLIAYRPLFVKNILAKHVGVDVETKEAIDCDGDEDFFCHKTCKFFDHDTGLCCSRRSDNYKPTLDWLNERRTQNAEN